MIRLTLKLAILKNFMKTTQMVKEFMDYLMDLQEKLLENLEPEIERAISFLQSEKEELFNAQKYKSKAELNKLYAYFKNYEVLKVYGFNSRYVYLFRLSRMVMCSFVQNGHMFICPE